MIEEDRMEKNGDTNDATTGLVSSSCSRGLVGEIINDDSI